MAVATEEFRRVRTAADGEAQRGGGEPCAAAVTDASRRRSAARLDRAWPAFATVSVLATVCASMVLVLDGIGALRERPTPLIEPVEFARAQTDDPTLDARELGAEVLARNVFDSQTGPLTWLEEAAQDGSDATTSSIGASEPPRRCENAQLRLIASVVNSVFPERSFAAVRWEGKTHMMGIGGQIGDVTLLALRPAQAYVRRGSTGACTLPVFLPASERPKVAAGAGPKPPTSAAKVKRRSVFSEQELNAGVRALGGGRYALSKSLLMRALRSPTGAGHGARLRPVERYGRTVGWEIARLRKDSALARMGLQKGDLLRSVNGHDLSDAGALLVALRMLQQTDSVTLAISRGNSAQHLHYTLE